MPPTDGSTTRATGCGRRASPAGAWFRDALAREQTLFQILEPRIQPTELISDLGTELVELLGDIRKMLGDQAELASQRLEDEIHVPKQIGSDRVHVDTLYS